MALFNSSYTNISSQFGMPLFGVGGLLPFTGNYFWVDGTNGSDGNTGGPQDPYKTVGQAYAACLAGNNDVVLVTGTTSLSATLTWAKNSTHMIGLAPSALSGAALLTVASTAATSGAFSPLVNVTASGCIFQNISTVSGIAQAATQVNWAEAGGKNTYINCNFNQVGNATAGAQAGNRALTVASANNLFQGCVIGSDAIVRATGTNSTVEFLAGTGSNIFRGSALLMWCSVAASSQVLAATATMSGTVIFDGCQLSNNLQGAGYVASTQAFNISSTAGGIVLVTPTTIVAGVTGLNTGGTGPVYASAAAAAATGNKVIAANP